jgi:meromycolic acid enoyl-[acyl-carrier protein] reductase
MILEGKKILVTGVVNRHSIAFSIAQRAQEEGAEVLLTSFGRVKRMTERSAARLPEPVEVLDLDVNADADFDALREQLASRWGRVDGAVHAIAFAPADALGGEFLSAPRESAKVAFETSAYSYKGLAAALAPLMGEGGGLVGLDFDATVAWPSYDWMGVAKAALESVNRYLARDLGSQNVRANLVAAGPIRTAAASGIPAFSDLEEKWSEQAPLGWEVDDPTPVADAVLFLLSDLSRAITGEIVHVDGGVHAIGAATPLPG